MYNIIAKVDVLQWIQGIAVSVKNVFSSFGTVGDLVLALLVFLLLKKVADKLKIILKKGFDRTSLDEKLAAKIGYKSDISTLLSTLAYLVLVIYAAIISLGIAGQEHASKPLMDMLSNMFSFVPNIVGACILLYILVSLANIVKHLLSNILEAINLDKRLSVHTGTPVTKSLVGAAYGFMLLLVAQSVLEMLKITSISKPVASVVKSITDAVPTVLLAGILIAIGVIVGQIAQRVVSNLLQGTGIDQLPAKVGLAIKEEGNTSLSSIAGYVVFVSIIVTLVSTALNQLNLPVLSELTANLVPGYYNVLLALLVLAVGIVGSKFVYNLLEGGNKCIAQGTRIVILVVSSVIALDRAGISREITNFPYLVAIGALGVAFGIGGAIAIGFGGREFVASILNKRIK